MSAKILPFKTRKAAHLSADSKFRFQLEREWDREKTKGYIAFIMLNPSTADAKFDDPTIRRCIGFANAWGYNQLRVINLFAYRATSPVEMFRVGETEDITGDPLNMEILSINAKGCDRVVCAWGNYGGERGEKVKKILQDSGVKLFHLGLTHINQPRHPLYVRGDKRLELWK